MHHADFNAHQQLSRTRYHVPAAPAPKSTFDAFRIVRAIGIVAAILIASRVFLP